MPKSFRTASASWSSCEKEATADRSSLRGVHPRSTLPSAADFANQPGDVMAKSYLHSSTIRRPSMQAMPGCMLCTEAVLPLGNRRLYTINTKLSIQIGRAPRWESDWYEV